MKYLLIILLISCSPKEHQYRVIQHVDSMTILRDINYDRLIIVDTFLRSGVYSREDIKVK